MSKIKILTEKLRDNRGKRVIFLSHCLLNENTRYLGGAKCEAGVNDIIGQLQSQGIGIVQMPCPEQMFWGGILKRKMLMGYGINHSILKFFRKIYVNYFIWQTKLNYQELANQIAHQIKDYIDLDFEVLGIMGIKGSPSCGVTQSLDIKKSSQYLAGLDLKELTKDKFNRDIYDLCLVDWEGLFIKALKQSLWKKKLEIKFLEFDMLKEINNESVEMVI